MTDHGTLRGGLSFQKVLVQAEIDTVERLAREIWQEHFTPIIGRAQVQYMLERFQSGQAVSDQISQGYCYYILNQGAEQLGYLAVLPQSDKLFLSKFYMRSAERGKGYARQSLIFIEKLASRLDMNRIWLTVNRNNSTVIKIYEHLGFHRVGTQIQDIGHGFVMDDFVMEKTVETVGN